MEIANCVVEEVFNKTMLLQYTENQSYIRQLCLIIFIIDPDNANIIMEKFKKELEKRTNLQINFELKENKILNITSRTEMIIRNLEFIVNELLITVTPYQGLQLLKNISMKKIFDYAITMFYTKIELAKTETSEIKELKHAGYHKYKRKIWQMYEAFTNFSEDMFNYYLIRPYQDYYDAKHISELRNVGMSIRKYVEIVKNLMMEDKILRKFNLQLINNFLINSEKYTRNVMLTIVLRYAIIQKVTGLTPTTLILDVSNLKITYEEIIAEIEKMNFDEDEIGYLFDVIKKIESVKIPIIALI